MQGSAVFDWNSIPARPTESGSVGLFFKGPTATLDSLDVHATTLNPAKAPHPPHKHLNEELVIWRMVKGKELDLARCSSLR